MNTALLTRVKLLALITASTFFVVARNIFVVGIISFALVGLCGLTIRRGRVTSRLRAVVGISLLVVLFQLVFNTSVSLESRLLLGAMTAMRLISLTLLVFLFIETTSPSSIVSALSFLPNKLCLMLTISFSLIPAIMQELSNIRLVQQSRGFSSKGMNVFRSIFPILVPLLNRTLTRAEHIAMALETRGFEG